MAARSLTAQELATRCDAATLQSGLVGGDTGVAAGEQMVGQARA
jgi:hypothetical protein